MLLQDNLGDLFSIDYTTNMFGTICPVKQINDLTRVTQDGYG